MAHPHVLVVGAGPSGLFLALSLARRGIVVRIVDKKKGPSDASRAIVVHARTMEIYAQMGIADEVVSQSVPVRALQILTPAGDRARVDLTDIGRGMSPYPNILCFGQDAHERLLRSKLEGMGVHVEWRTELTSLRQLRDFAEVTLTDADGSRSTFDVPFVCGCDGTHSTVREALGIGFEGGSYDRLYFVVDARATDAHPEDILLCIGSDSLAASFPVRPGEVRLLGVVPAADVERRALAFEDVRGSIESLLKVHVQSVNWFSTFHSHHRVAERFRSGRCFLVGDAGHVHSPVGGQGMNTGLGDAFNLSWKLAEVLHGRADACILDTYEPERIAFARKLVATTDAVFQRVIGRDRASRFLRRVVPRVMSRVLRFEKVRRALFDMVSQVHVEYEHSSLSEGSVGSIRGGDRLPWVGEGPLDNFAPLRSNAWQLHVYGALTAEMTACAASLSLPTHAFPWSNAAKIAGFTRDAAYLVRPDGYVALTTRTQIPNGSAPIRFDVG